MEDSVKKEFESQVNGWFKDTENFLGGFTGLVNQLTKDLTPEDRKMIDKELEKLDTSELKNAVDSMTKDFMNVVNNK